MAITAKQTSRTWHVLGDDDYEVFVVADKIDKVIDVGTTGDYVPVDFAIAQAKTVLEAAAWLHDND